MAGHMRDDYEMMVEAKDKEHKYGVEDDVRTLTKAEEIKKDKKRYDEACAMMKDMMMGMGKAMMGNKMGGMG